MGPGLSRRRFLQLLGGALALAGTQACLGRPDAEPTEQAQIVYQDWRTEWFPAMVREQLALFHERHPDVHVFYTPDPEDLIDAMPREMVAGTAPDVLQGCCTHFPTWAQGGHLLDLQPWVARDIDVGTLDDWDRVQYEALALRDGIRFGLPKYHGALALYYNRDHFDKVGYPYPDGSWNHDDYLDAMRALTVDLTGDGSTDVWGSMLDITWDRLQVHANAWGGHFVDPEDSTRSLMGSDEALEAMEWIRARMWDDRVMASSLDVHNLTTRRAFANGSLAMVEDGSWALKDILTDAEFRVGVAPMPSGPARRATLATTDGFGIYAGTRHPEASWELVKFLIGPEYGRAMAQASFLQPARASLLPDWERYIRAEFPDRTAEMELSAFADGHLKGYSVVAETFANMANATSIAQSAWHRVFTLGLAPTSAIVEASADIQAGQ